jgi:molybdenum cofactor cytidylyltransferase
MAESTSCALLLLAAGGSRRLGEPKQLVIVEGEPLIQGAVRIALAV